jgi:hypothetical protein
MHYFITGATGVFGIDHRPLTDGLRRYFEWEGVQS